MNIIVEGAVVSGLIQPVRQPSNVDNQRPNSPGHSLPSFI